MPSNNREACQSLLIINSLVFSSKDFRCREELMFQIMHWTNFSGIGALIFAESSKYSLRPGKLQSGGGMGKLAAIAKSIIYAIAPEDEY
jgi:hypothetical protein